MTGGDMYALLLLQHTTDRSDITEHKSICGPCKGAQSSGIRRRYGLTLSWFLKSYCYFLSYMIKTTFTKRVLLKHSEMEKWTCSFQCC